MPDIDGFAVCRWLKMNAETRDIPVIMLTAEGGWDNVLKIAKIGVRDYLVKPFKEEALVEKTLRVVELSPQTETAPKAKSIFDPANILLVEDKPAIRQLIQEGLKHTPWKVHCVETDVEENDFCANTPPDLVIASLEQTHSR